MTAGTLKRHFSATCLYDFTVLILFKSETQWRHCQCLFDKKTVYSQLPLPQPSQTRTCRTKMIFPFFHKITVILPSVTRTSRRLEVIFASLQIISTYNFTLDNSNHFLSAWQVGKKSCTVHSPRQFFVFL